MKSFTFYLFFTIFIFSCKETTEPEPKIPDFVLSFNGQDGFVELPQLAFFNLPSGTVELNIYVNRYHGDLLYKETFNASTISGMRINDEGKIICSHENFLSAGDVVSTSVLKLNRWYHIAWTWDGVTSKIYVNGVLDSSQPCNDKVSDQMAEWLRVGSGDYYFQGKLDDLRIWRIAKSPDQILSQMSTELSGMEGGLSGNWSFNEAKGDTAFDNSVFGFHGILVGGVAWVTL